MPQKRSCPEAFRNSINDNHDRAAGHVCDSSVHSVEKAMPYGDIGFRL